MRIAPRPFNCILLIFFACGCSDGPDSYEVAGTITLDGQPIKDGEVILSAIDNSSSTAGKIQAGQYQLTAVAGSHKVMINSSVKERNPLPQPLNAPRGDEWYYRSLIPIRYNDETTLSAKVKPSNDNQLDFELTSSPEQAGN